MIIVSEQKDGISAVLRMIHDTSVKLKAEKIRCEKDYGVCDKVKHVDDAMRLYYEWGNIDIIKV